MSALAERLGEIDLYSEVTLELADGTTVEGKASPIDFDPDEHLRMELRPFEEESGHRYEVHAHRRGGEWETPHVREIEPSSEDDWTELGDVADFSVPE